MPAFAPYKSTHDLSVIEFGSKPTMKDDTRYDALRNVDNHSDSSTEVEDWDTEGDLRPRRRKTFWRKVKGYRWLLDTGLLLVIVGLLVEKRWKHTHKSHRFELAGDLTGFAPTFSQQIVSFKPDPVFAPEDARQFWSNETRQAWLDIVPGTSLLSYILSLRPLANRQQRDWATSTSRTPRNTITSPNQSMIIPTKPSIQLR